MIGSVIWWALKSLDNLTRNGEGLSEFYINVLRKVWSICTQVIGLKWLKIETFFPPWQASNSRGGVVDDKSEARMEEGNKDHIRRDGKQETRGMSGRHNFCDYRETTPLVQKRRRWFGVGSRDPFSEGTHWLHALNPFVGRGEDELDNWRYHIPWIWKDHCCQGHAKLQRARKERKFENRIPSSISNRTHRWTTIWYSWYSREFLLINYLSFFEFLQKSTIVFAFECFVWTVIFMGFRMRSSNTH